MKLLPDMKTCLVYLAVFCVAFGQLINSWPQSPLSTGK